MSSSITHTQTRSLQAGSIYRVVDSISASTTIDPSLFVFSTDSQKYNRVATVLDLAVLLDTYAAAVTAGAAYYRLAEVTYDTAVLEDAVEFAVEIKGLLAALLHDYDLATTSFVGAETETIP